WFDVTNLAPLEQEVYDIIILDIGDVGQKISTDEGLGVLKAVRSVSPTQIIVAYSNKGFSLRLKQFLNLATESIDKNVTDYADCKAVIDELLEETEKSILHRNPAYFENRMHPQTKLEKDAVAIGLRHIRSAINVLERCHGS